MFDMIRQKWKYVAQTYIFVHGEAQYGPLGWLRVNNAVSFHMIQTHVQNIYTNYCHLYFMNHFFENAHTKLVTFHKRSNRMNVFFDSVSTHECLIKQACKFFFIIDLRMHKILRSLRIKCMRDLKLDLSMHKNMF